MKIFIYILLLPLYLFSQNIEQKEGVKRLKNNWYESNAYVQFHEDITKSQAEKNAIDRALKQIIEYHSGVEITSSSLSILTETNFELTDHFSRLINTASGGIILEKTLLESEIDELFGNQIYRVKVKAKVGELKGEKDPLFQVEATLNRKYYQNGDEMLIDIKSSKDCFIYIFNILSDGTVSVLLPNEYIDNQFLSAGSSITIPSDLDRNRGIRYKVGLLPDKEHDTEMILVLAIKSIDGNKKDFELNFGNQRKALKELQSWIIDFPRDMIEQVNISYLIKGNNEE